MKKLLRLRVSVGVECQDVRREPTRANRSGQLKQQSTEVDCDITANKGTYGECELPGAVFFFFTFLLSSQVPPTVAESDAYNLTVVLRSNANKCLW